MTTTLIQSTLHGRKRRLLRRIEKTEIEECLAFGIKEPSIKGRWKYTYNELVLIMDPTNTTEITSFIMPLEMERAEYDNYYVEEHNEAKKAIIEEKSLCASHTIIVIDMSGSMRRADVANFVTRYKAVVSTIASEYIASQLIRNQVKNSDVITIIRMGTKSDVLIEREPVSWVLYNMVLELRIKRPDFHGNYIPALEKTKELFDKYDHPNVALCMFFLSDGKPSDSNCCKGLNHALSETYISDEMRTIAQQYGSRLSTNFIGFGPYTYDFEILEKLSKISEELGCVSQFIHSKLDSTILKESINSSAKRLSETRTSLTIAGGRTLRPSLETKENPTSGYFFYPEVQNKVWSSIDNNWILKPFAQGIALCKDKLGIGAERVVFSLHVYDRYHSTTEEALSAGFRFKQSELVGKESKFVEDVQSSERFHKTFIITQQKASELAIAFNSSISKLPSFCPYTTPSISFLDCYLFYVPSKQISILVEKRLDIKKYKKFNDNMGGVDYQASHPPINLHKGLHFTTTVLNTIKEDEKDEDENEEEEDDSNLARMERVTISPSNSNNKIDPDHIPQAFSHFTYHHSNRKLLVCDLQGVFNADTCPPTYELTDPVIHYKSSIGRKNTFGRTDCGKQGISDFFRSHICNPLCKLVLPQKKKAQIMNVIG